MVVDVRQEEVVMQGQLKKRIDNSLFNIPDRFQEPESTSSSGKPSPHPTSTISRPTSDSFTSGSTTALMPSSSNVTITINTTSTTPTSFWIIPSAFLSSSPAPAAGSTYIPAASSAAASRSQSHRHVPAIIAGIITGTFALIGIITAIMCMRRRRKRPRQISRKLAAAVNPYVDESETTIDLRPYWTRKFHTGPGRNVVQEDSHLFAEGGKRFSRSQFVLTSVKALIYYLYSGVIH